MRPKYKTGENHCHAIGSDFTQRVYIEREVSEARITEGEGRCELACKGKYILG